jgi:serine/threonine protein kinase
MPPEVLSGSKSEAGPGIDIWALGCMLYAMVIGVMPFTGSTEEELYNSILKKKLKFKNEKPISKEFKDLILQILTKDPEARINMFDLQNHQWNEMPKEELEKSIEDSKLEEEEEEKKKQEEEDLSYLERLNLKDVKDVKGKSPYTGDHYELSVGGKNKKAPRLSPRFTKGGSDGNLNGSIKKNKKSIKKKKKVSIPKP